MTAAEPSTATPEAPASAPPISPEREREGRPIGDILENVNGYRGTVAPGASGTGDRLLRQAAVGAEILGVADAIQKVTNGEGTYSDIVTLAESATEAGRDAGNALTRSRARSRAERAFRQAAPRASARVTRAASAEATRASMGPEAAKATTPQEARGLVRRRTNQAILETSRNSPNTLAQNMDEANWRTARQVAARGANEATGAAGDFLATSRLAQGSRALSRFVPFLGVAAAAADWHSAYTTWNDPNAGGGDITGATMTAVGSSMTTNPVTYVPGLIVQGLGSLISWWYSGD